MENTLENKAKFFAQYWGQKIFNSDSDGWGLREINHNVNYPLDEWDYISLKPLSSISDEDLLKCYHIHSAIISYDYTMDFKPFLDMAKYWIEKEGNKPLYKYTELSDYLRGKGYAMPFMSPSIGKGLSVEKQIEYGWIKLIN